MSTKLRRLFTVTILALAGCGAFGDGSNVVYYKVALGSTSALTGTNCASSSDDVITWTGIDGNGTVAIYTLPSSGSYLLDYGSGAGIEGTLASGTYTFTGSEQSTTIEQSNINTLVKITIQLTTSGSGVTGTETVEQSCSSNTADQCSDQTVSAQDGDYDCIESGSLVGSQIPSPTQVAVETVSQPGGPSQPQ